MIVQVYLDRFQNSVKVMEHCGGDIGIDPELVDTTLDLAMPKFSQAPATPDQLLATEAYTREEYLA